MIKKFNSHVEHDGVVYITTTTEVSVDMLTMIGEVYRVAEDKESGSYCYNSNYAEFCKIKEFFPCCLKDDKYKELVKEIYDISEAFKNQNILVDYDSIHDAVIKDIASFEHKGKTIERISVIREYRDDDYFLNSLFHEIQSQLPENRKQDFALYKMFGVFNGNNVLAILRSIIKHLQEPQIESNTYIAVGYENYYKIGKTINEIKRISSLKTSNPDIEYIIIIGCDVEKELHNAFSHKRITGEWFNLTKTDLENILFKYKDNIMLNLYKKDNVK